MTPAPQQARARRAGPLVLGATLIAIGGFAGGGAVREALIPRQPVERISVPPEAEQLPTGQRCWIVPLGVPLRPPEVLPAALALVREVFADPQLGARGWYDNLAIDVQQGAARFHFRTGQSYPDSGAGTRILFPPHESVRVRYRVKYEPGWLGSGQSFHPHELYLLTDVDGRWAGLARSHLTVYMEQNAGRPVMLIQDALNIGTPAGAVAGCDGTPGDCYTSGGNRMNGRSWPAPVVALPPGEWHTVEAEIRLNTPGQADGVLRLTVNGTRVVNVTDAVLRTTAHPTMRFNQLVIGPYMNRSPVDQTFWLDDLEVKAP